MYIHSFSEGFIEVPNKIMLNLYVYGCKHNCKGCSNKKLQRFTTNEKYFYNEKAFAKVLNDNKGLIDGICWLGGDAVFQLSDLINFSKLIKSYSLYNCLYTGFLFEHLDAQLLNYLDMIVDGKWEGKVISDPNTNQRIWVKNKNVWHNISHNELMKDMGDKI